MNMTENAMAMTLSKRAMKNVESMAMDMARQTIMECASLYNFSADEAIERLGATQVKLRADVVKAKGSKKEAKVKAIKAAFPLPFSGTIAMTAAKASRRTAVSTASARRRSKKAASSAADARHKPQRTHRGNPTAASSGSA